MEVLSDKLTAKYFDDNEKLSGEECRICLKKSDDIWQPVFQPDGEIPMKIMACATVQVIEGDGLPNIICHNCRQLLDVSYNFKCQVEISDAKFRETLKFKEQSLFHDTAVNQSVNAAITEAISDDIDSKQMDDNIIKNAIECVTNDQCNGEFLAQQLIHNNETSRFEEDNIEKENKEDILDISTYVENAEILVDKFDKLTENDLLADPIKEEDTNCHKNNDSLLSSENTFKNEIQCYLEITKSIESNENDKSIDKTGEIMNEISEAMGESVGEMDTWRDDSDSEQEQEEEIATSTRKLRQKGIRRITNHPADQKPQQEANENGNKTKYRYVCYMCEKQFISIKKLKSHVINSHDSLKNKDKKSEEQNCLLNEEHENPENCEKKENDENKYSGSRSRMEKKKVKFSCKYCSKQFTYEKSFLSHAKRHPEYTNQGLKINNGAMEECNEPQINDSEDNNDDDDDDDDMPIKGLQCTECGKLFATKRNLKRHISTHSGLKFNCTTCDKEFSRADKLKEHEQSKHKNEFFMHSEDENDTDTENENKRNGDNSEIRKEEKNNRPHQCPMCPKSFAHSQTLTNHMERHKRTKQPQKRFLCEVCSKCFAQSGSLVAHMRTHTGVKPYVCNVCSRAFTKSTYLQLHLRTHSGEKPYICQYCSRAFARANTLARHITMHTGEAKYHCQICMKSFRRLTSLNEHTYTHTGQRPYACKICTKRYNNAGSLYAHTKKCKAAQQLTNNSVTNNYTVPIENTTTDDHNNPSNNPSSPMLIYTQKKCDQQVVHQSTLPQFIITNIHTQKPQSTDLPVQPVNSEDTSLYSVNTKQFKNFYYTTYPSL